MPLTHRSSWLLLALLALLVACATPAPPLSASSPFEQDVLDTGQGLFTQWRAQAGHSGSGRKVAIGAINDLVDLTNGAQRPLQEESEASAQVKKILARQIDAQVPELKRVAAEQANSHGSDYLISGSLMRSSVGTPTGSNARGPAKPADSKAQAPLVLTLLMLDLKSRQVVARWQGPLRALQGQLTPTAYFHDSPVLLSGRRPNAAEERNSQLLNAPAGATVGADSVEDAWGLALLSQAQEAYAADNYAKALELFQAAAARPGPLALRAHNGIYLSHLKLGQNDLARQDFRRVVAEGLATRSLAVKFLFMPGQTSFWSDPSVSGHYDFWLQEISAQIAASPQCLEVAGHTSRSGEEAFNQKLSLARSEKVRGLMQALQPSLTRRISASGKGWLENIVGSGSDDARDAIDRRVEFKLLDCAVR